MGKIDVSAIIPAFNESGKIINAIEKTAAYFETEKLEYEIIVVNDGSSDNSLALLRAFSEKNSKIKIISLAKNYGKGYAVKTGMMNAVGTYRIFFDADLSVPLETVKTFLNTLKNNSADVVIGTRKTKGAVITKKQPFYREFLGKGFSKITNIILGTNYSDITCGFKCFKEESAKKIFSRQKINRWSFDSEILFLAKKLNYRVAEIPVVWKNNPATKVKVIRDIVVSLFELIRIRFIYL